jgi:Holliday junction resolvase RusA-like endonuclease
VTPRVEEFIVPHPPRVKGRPRLGRRRRVFTPEATLEYEAKVAQAWLDHGADTFTGNVSVEVLLFGDHSVVTIRELMDGKAFVTGDADNYLKSHLDGLQGEGLAFPDDKFVMHVAGTKMIRGES